MDYRKVFRITSMVLRVKVDEWLLENFSLLETEVGDSRYDGARGMPTGTTTFALAKSQVQGDIALTS